MLWNEIRDMADITQQDNSELDFTLSPVHALVYIFKGLYWLQYRKWAKRGAKVQMERPIKSL